MEKNLEEIKNYIDRTNVPNNVRANYSITVSEIYAILDETDRATDAIYTAFQFGFSKGWRAHKAQK